MAIYVFALYEKMLQSEHLEKQALARALMSTCVLFLILQFFVFFFFFTLGEAEVCNFHCQTGKIVETSTHFSLELFLDPLK